jgi:hypothetical protein
MLPRQDSRLSGSCQVLDRSRSHGDRLPVGVTSVIVFLVSWIPIRARSQSSSPPFHAEGFSEWGLSAVGPSLPGMIFGPYAFDQSRRLDCDVVYRLDHVLQVCILEHSDNPGPFLRGCLCTVRLFHR